MKKTSSFKHALVMVLKNKRAYLLLSVTIVMSFTFLLSFLIYTDSKVLTENTEVIMQEPYLFQTNLTEVATETIVTYMNNLDQIEDTHYYIAEDVVLGQSYNKTFDAPIAIQGNAWSVHLRNEYEIVMESGEKIQLSSGQGVVKTELYNKLKNENSNGKIIVEIPIELNNGNIIYRDIEIIGGFKLKNSIEKDALGENNLIISQDTIKELDYNVNNKRMYVYTKYPKKVKEASKNLNLYTNSIYEDRFEQFPKIKKDLNNKAMIMIILFVLLGINLYSSFNNALNERKFEIGVKRAIGASTKDIVLQFLYEGIIVVFTNILISSMLSVTIFIGYKWYLNVVKDTVYIFNISKYSIEMYLIASVFLTLAFSLLFAIQSARVEIIKYIKGE